MNEPDHTFVQNETLRSIGRRRSIRAFVDESVPDDHIRAILQAANQVPSAHNQQSWRFIVVKGGKKKELAHLVASRAAAFARLLRRHCCAWQPGASSVRLWLSLSPIRASSSHDLNGGGRFLQNS